MPPRRIMKPDPLEPKPPESFRIVKWLLLHGWEYKRYVLGAVVFLGALAFIKWPGLRVWRSNKVTATVLAFDPDTAELSLRLNNGTGQSVILAHIYYTFFTTNREALRPISSEYASECADGLTKVPETGGFEIMHRELRQEVRLSEQPVISLDWGIATNRWLVRLMEPVLLSIDAGKPLLTNLVPYSVGFRTACDLFVDDAPFELGVHFGLWGASASEGVYEVDLPLGLFTKSRDRSRFEPKIGFPVTVDLKQSDPRMWKRVKESAIHVPSKQWVLMRPAEESTESGTYYFRVMTGSNVLFLCPGEIATNRPAGSKSE